MNTRKKIPRINRQDRQKITFHVSAYPKEISQQYTSATHIEAVAYTARGQDPQNRTLLPQAKYLWQAARIANMAIYAGCP